MSESKARRGLKGEGRLLCDSAGSGSVASCPRTQVVDDVSLRGFLCHVGEGKHLCKGGGDNEADFNRSVFRIRGWRGSPSLPGLAADPCAERGPPLVASSRARLAGPRAPSLVPRAAAAQRRFMRGDSTERLQQSGGMCRGRCSLRAAGRLGRPHCRLLRAAAFPVQGFVSVRLLGTAARGAGRSNRGAGVWRASAQQLARTLESSGSFCATSVVKSS